MSTAPTIRTAITAKPIQLASLVERIGSDSDGAVAVFVGRVRDMNDGRRVVRLGYEAYEEMAETVLRTIVEEAALEHRVGEITAVHRTGTLEPGEVAVAIAVAAPHRDGAYAASRYVIEQIKQRLPVWKREAYASGEEEWQSGGAETVATSRGGGEGE